MSDKPESTKFQKGVSGNPNGRPKGSGKGKSRLRQTLAKYYRLEDKSFEVLETMLAGKKEADMTPTEKTQFEAAKLVLKSIETLNESCLREETAILKVKEKNEAAGEHLEDTQAEKDTVLPSTFSMNMEDTVAH